MGEIREGNVYAVTRSESFVGNSELQVVWVNSSEVGYIYTSGANKGLSRVKGIEDFTRLVNDDGVRLKEQATSAADPFAIEVKAGQRYETAKFKADPFSSGEVVVISSVALDVVYYSYEGGLAGTMSRDIKTFTRAISAGVLSLVPGLAGLAPALTTTVSVHQKYRVSEVVSTRFLPGLTLVVTGVHKDTVRYLYENTPSTQYTKALEHFEESIKLQALELVGVVKPKASSLSSWDSPAAQAKIRHDLTQDLHRLLGIKADRHLHEEVLQRCRTHLPTRIKPSLVFDMDGRFQGVKLRDMVNRLAEVQFIPEPPKPAQPLWPPIEVKAACTAKELEEQYMTKPLINLDYAALEARVAATVTAGMLDSIANYCGVNREGGEGDESLRGRLSESLGGGASRQKNVQEGIVGRAGTVLVDDEPTPIFFKRKPEPNAQTNLEKPMTRIVNVFLMDTTAGLKAAERMIGKVENFASDARDNTTMLLELSMEHNLKGMLDDHNKRRKAIINQDILDRVGKTVYLQPIELKDVKIDIKVVTEV